MAEIRTLHPRKPDERPSISHEAEQSLLGGLLMDAARFPDIAKFLSVEDFADPMHCALYEAIGRLARAGQPVDPLTVADLLEREDSDAYADVEVRVYLGQLAANTPSAANVVRYAQIVRERAIERRQRAAQRPEREPRAERDGRIFAPDGTPVVQWKEGNLPAIVDQAEAALIDADLGIYQRDRMLVRVLRRAEPSIRNYKRKAGVLGIVPVEPAYLIETMARTAIWERWDPRSDKFRRINPPDRVAATYLARAGEWRVPRLWDTISAPTLRPDGTVLQKPGYDEATHVYYDPCGVDFPPVPDKPTEEDARHAYELLVEAFGSFPYESPVDRAVALAAAMTGVVRRALYSAPLVAISAPVPNSGKTLLADGIAILPMGSTAPVMTFAETDEEAKKTALAVLMEGDPVVLIDNVERPLTGDWLCTILTSEIYRQRVLGRTEMISVPTRMLLLATGNHIEVLDDLRSRTLLCRIDAKLENPGERVFRSDLRETMIARRPELVVACLTLMRAFVYTGQNPQKFVKQWGRFERWSDMVRAPLAWMGAADPCLSIKELERRDPRRGDHVRLLSLWWRCFESEERTTKEVVEHLNRPSRLDHEEQLYQLLREIAADQKTGDINTRVLGKRLQKVEGNRVSAEVGGKQVALRIERAGEKDHVVQWRVTREVPD